jgi:CubicO group peptidase (beta-lactamase class C family)
VIVTRGGETLYSAGRGLADMETRRPITPGTVFRLGSITKQFTAAVILQLVREGKVSLDDPVSRFFPDFPQPGGSATVRQLLNHVSGIQSYTAVPGFMTEANISRPFTTAELIAVTRDLPSVSPPGQAWTYNNSGYVLLGAIIESVTGKPWHQAVVERISRPLRLPSIGWGGDREALPDMARGYTMREGAVRPAWNTHMSVPHAAGALVGTVGDLAKWARALHHGRVVSPELYRAMIKPVTLADGSTHPYGFGLAMEKVRGRDTIQHNGGISGFNTDSIYIPGEDVFVAIFTNSDEPTTHPTLVSRRLAALAVGDPYRTFTAVELAPDAVAPFFGVYAIGDTGVSRRFYSRDGKFYTLRDGGGESEVRPAGDGHFFYPGNNNWFRLLRRPDGALVMEMHQDGANEGELARRTGDLPPERPAASVSRVILQSYVGRYETVGPAAEIALREDGVLTLQLAGQPAFPLRAVSDTEFTIEQVGARIVFHGENGQVNRFVIHQGGQQLEGRRAPR